MAREHDHDGTPGLPPIERWWPHLPTVGKHALLADPESPLSESLLHEIAAVAGVEVPLDHDIVLSASDRDFIETQREAVD